MTERIRFGDFIRDARIQQDEIHYTGLDDKAEFVRPHGGIMHTIKPHACTHYNLPEVT